MRSFEIENLLVLVQEPNPHRIGSRAKETAFFCSFLSVCFFEKSSRWNYWSTDFIFRKQKNSHISPDSNKDSPPPPEPLNHNTQTRNKYLQILETFSFLRIIPESVSARHSPLTPTRLTKYWPDVRSTMTFSATYSYRSTRSRRRWSVKLSILSMHGVKPNLQQ